MPKIEINLEEITKQMDDLKDLEARLKFDLKNTQKEIEKIELKLQALLENMEVESMDFGIYTFGWETKTRKAFSQKAFGQVYPDLLEKFKIETESKSFEFYINRPGEKQKRKD